MVKPKVYYTIGISGSGKSTYAAKLAKETGLQELNADNERLAQLGSINDQSMNGAIFMDLKTKKLDLLENGEGFIDSNTNLNPHNLMFELRMMRDFGADIELKILDVPLDVCIKRVRDDITNNKVRSDVPEGIIKNQYRSFKRVVKWAEEQTEFRVSHVTTTNEMVGCVGGSSIMTCTPEKMRGIVPIGADKHSENPLDSAYSTLKSMEEQVAALLYSLRSV